MDSMMNHERRRVLGLALIGVLGCGDKGGGNDEVASATMTGAEGAEDLVVHELAAGSERHGARD